MIDLALARAKRLRRSSRQVPMLGYAVIDLETTGLRPGGYDRIVEIAIVRLDESLRVTEEWCTLVNPERDIGSRSIHGISALQVASAPTFGEVAGDVMLRVASTVIVGHNVSFDLAFLCAEFTRCGWPNPNWEGLCTLELATISGKSGSRSLAGCCASLGITHENAHSALGDARACAELLRRYLRDIDADAVLDITPSPADAPSLPDRHKPVRLVTRAESSILSTASSLKPLVERLPGALPAVDADPTAVLGYVDLLDRTIEDRTVTDEEARALAEFAGAHDLGREAVEDIHRSYMTSLVAVAARDGKLTTVELDDLRRVSAVLGMNELLDALLKAVDSPIGRALSAFRDMAGLFRADASVLPPIDRRGEFHGKTVCFTGESVCGFDRETQEVLAAAAGVVVMPRVTRALDVLVLADPASQSTKARTARGHGVRMVAERAFWPAIGVTIE